MRRSELPSMIRDYLYVRMSPVSGQDTNTLPHFSIHGVIDEVNEIMYEVKRTVNWTDNQTR